MTQIYIYIYIYIYITYYVLEIYDIKYLEKFLSICFLKIKGYVMISYLKAF